MKATPELAGARKDVLTYGSEQLGVVCYGGPEVPTLNKEMHSLMRGVITKPAVLLVM